LTDYSSVIPAKARIQGDRAPAAAPCSSQGQALDPRFRGGDDVKERHTKPVYDEQALPATRVRGYWQSVFYRLQHDPVTLFFAAIVVLIVLAAVCAPLIAPFDPYKESIVGRLKPFGWRGHPLGTDELGRDWFSRLVHGASVSLLLAPLAAALSMVFALTLGAWAGMRGGFVDETVMRASETFVVGSCVGVVVISAAR